MAQVQDNNHKNPQPIQVVNERDAHISGLALCTPGSHLGLVASMSVSIVGGQPPVMTLVCLPSILDIHFRVKGGPYDGRILHLWSKKVDKEDGTVSMHVMLQDENGEKVNDIGAVNLSASADVVDGVVVGTVMTVEEIAASMRKMADQSKAQGPAQPN